MRKKIAIAVCVFSVYLLLLILLVLFESAAPGSSIRSMGDALWYSLVTMTTVGYGDMFPVSAGGRAVGFIFLIVSTGILALALSFAAALILGHMFPKLQLTLWRRRPFFIFNSREPEALLLAEKLYARRSDAVFIFPKGQGGFAGKRAVCCNAPVREILDIGKSIGGIFILGPDSLQNLGEAGELESLGAPIYCESLIRGLEADGRINVFNRYENLARMYWQLYPLELREGRIVFIGTGEYTRHMLEQALLVNVFEPERRTEYHVFGDSSQFLLEHPRLGDMLSIGAVSEDRDSVFFHSEPWNADGKLLAGAQRLIICSDDDGENLAVLSTLRRCYPTEAQVYVRLLRSFKAAGEHSRVFGSCESLFTPELVMRQQLSRLAKAMNELYRAEAGGGAPGWDELEPFKRRSCMAAADHLLTKIRLLLPQDDVREVTRESCAAAYRGYKASLPQRAELYRIIEHERWLRFHYMNNWSWAEMRDDRLRLHPLICPFSQLALSEQQKDDSAWELLAHVGDML